MIQWFVRTIDPSNSFSELFQANFKFQIYSSPSAEGTFFIATFFSCPKFIFTWNLGSRFDDIFRCQSNITHVDIFEFSIQYAVPPPPCNLASSKLDVIISYENRDLV